MCSVIPGETPRLYVPEAHEGLGDDSGRKRAAVNEQGSRRKLEYPPAPEPLPVPVIDNHTHMDFHDGDVALSVTQHMDVAEQVGISGAIQVGTDVESSRWSVAAAEADRRVLAAVALHPNDAARAYAEGTLDDDLSVIEQLAAHPRVRAIGETGLDYFRTTEDGWAGQHESFRRHLDIARRLNLPVQIHDRDAHEDTVRILEEENFDGTVVFHCFSGPVSMAQKAREKGWYVSFGGTATFKNNHELREAIIAAGPQLLMAETDAPFLTAHPFRGRPNAPYMTPYAVRYVAEMFGWDLDEFCHILTENSERVYGDFNAGFTQF